MVQSAACGLGTFGTLATPTPAVPGVLVHLLQNCVQIVEALGQEEVSLLEMLREITRRLPGIEINQDLSSTHHLPAHTTAARVKSLSGLVNGNISYFFQPNVLGVVELQ